MKNIRVFLSENFQFLEVKFSIYLNRRVFVMYFYVSVVIVPLLLESTYKSGNHISGIKIFPCADFK